ncbi:hypothetical protein [Planomicrobium sp. CPCC 101079]|uniref:hypothetical protein n=1 Tax=Planomicrobium sp. CPCC 101079 TaxID=2599618 RepID=UPI0011B5BED3|nr:hypothetical protein [Planomicrobium sp. CPCC 101079]TWT14549.1 hypothetical protein FQV28_00990 [Planomicrobium sp. CPCC 101079]
MDKIKIHPLILLAIGISAISMCVRAYENLNATNGGYGITFGVLGVLFAILAVYGWMRNQRIDRINRRIKKGQKLIR